MFKSINILTRVHIPPSSLRCYFSTCNTRFAGHNKWSKIKDKKGSSDTQKSLLYGNANRDIIVAARSGGSSDPSLNLQLATVLKKYKDQGVPKENLEKAIAKVAHCRKEKGGESVIYEALAFNSVGVIIECLTDNATRTIHNVRHVLSRHNAHLAPIMFMFKRKGCLKVSLDRPMGNPEFFSEQIIEAALSAGADDFDQLSDNYNIPVLKFICSPDALGTVTSALMENPSWSLHLQSSELIFAPKEIVEISPDLHKCVSALKEELEADEDILRIWTSLHS